MKCLAALFMIFLIMSPEAADAQTNIMNSLLQIVPSPEADGMGAISSTLMTENALGTSYNPGYLGVFAQTHFINAGTYTSLIPLYSSGYLTDPVYHSSAVNVGLNLASILHSSLPLSLGLGYSDNSITGGIFAVSNSSPVGPDYFESSERSRIISLGIGLDYILQFGVGISYKYIDSKLFKLNSTFAQTGNSEANASAWDFGAFLRAPLLKFLASSEDLDQINVGSSKPFLDLLASYNLQDMGPGIEYTDFDIPDPFPRNSTLGLSFRLGMISHTEHYDWEFVSLTAAREANDLLLGYHPQDTIYTGNGFFTVKPSYPVYDGSPGAIQFLNNVILGKNNGKVEIRSGLQLNLGEILYIRAGSIEHGVEAISTTGFGVRMGGILKLIDHLDRIFSSAGVLSFVGRHLDLQIDYARFNSNQLSGDNKTFESLNVSFK